MATVTNRRAFFEDLLASSNKLAVKSLDEYTEPLKLTDVYHLLKRCLFSVDIDFAKAQVGKTAREVIGLLMTPKGDESLPAFDINFAFPDPDKINDGVKAAEQRRKNLFQRYDEVDMLNNWWISKMKTDTESLHEKVMVFWHGHFTTESKGADIPAQWMYKQNQLLRTFLFSDFKTILEKVTLDGAMLLYLNGDENKKEAPNENYARELFELFSIGLGDGHYTEDDIREAAKILTAWRASHFEDSPHLYEPFFDPNQHNTDDKEVFGVSFTTDFEVTTENVVKNAIQKLMSVILSEKGDEVALFMATKMYRYWVYSKPVLDEANASIKELASFFKSSNFDVKTTITKLLRSQHFFDINNRGIQIKSPLENLLSFTAHFSMETDEIRARLIDLDQELLNPPNVSGWRGYRNWITTKTLPYFITTFNSLLSDTSDTDVGLWAADIDGYTASDKLTEEISLLFLGRLPDESRMAILEGFLLGSAPDYEWPELATSIEILGQRVKVLLKEMLKMPDFYLA